MFLNRYPQVKIYLSISVSKTTVKLSQLVSVRQEFTVYYVLGAMSDLWKCTVLQERRIVCSGGGEAVGGRREGGAVRTSAANGSEPSCRTPNELAPEHSACIACIACRRAPFNMF